MKTAPEEFDEEYYLKTHADIAVAIQEGVFTNAKEHYEKFGRQEGRACCFPEVDKRVAGGGIYTENYFLYPYKGVKKHEEIIFSAPSLDSEGDRPIVERIITAYHAAVKDQPEDFRYDKEGMWSFIRLYCRPLLNAIDAKDVEETGRLLSRMFLDYTTWGLGLSASTAYIAEKAPSQFSDLIQDRILRLGEAIGYYQARNPEQGVYNAELDVDTSAVVNEVMRKAGIEIPERPDIGGFYGVRVGKSIIHIRDISHMMLALQLQKYNTSNIIEIGGGYGGLVFWMHTFGFKDILSLDLPHMNVIQAYFLLKSKIDANIVLYGEENTAKEAIRISPYWAIDTIQDKSYNACVNQDSLPEMSPAIAAEYMKQIQRTTKEIFYSVNQESAAANHMADKQNIVQHLARDQKGLKQIQRSLFWVRPGYVEEVYAIRK